MLAVNIGKDSTQTRMINRKMFIIEYTVYDTVQYPETPHQIMLCTPYMVQYMLIDCYH